MNRTMRATARQFVLLLALLIPQALAACSCGVPTDPCEIATIGPYVARVRILPGALYKAWGWVRHGETRQRAQVIEVLKGPDSGAKEIVVASPLPIPGSCYLGLAAGHEYLLVGSPDGDVVNTNLCSHTRPWYWSGDVISWIRQGRQKIFGRVVDDETNAPVESAPVDLGNADSRWSAKSDEEGRFEFDDLPTGQYQIRIAGTTANLILQANECVWATGRTAPNPATPTQVYLNPYRARRAPPPSH